MPLEPIGTGTLGPGAPTVPWGRPSRRFGFNDGPASFSQPEPAVDNIVTDLTSLQSGTGTRISVNVDILTINAANVGKNDSRSKVTLQSITNCPTTSRTATRISSLDVDANYPMTPSRTTTRLQVVVLAALFMKATLRTHTRAACVVTIPGLDIITIGRTGTRSKVSPNIGQDVAAIGRNDCRSRVTLTDRVAVISRTHTRSKVDLIYLNPAVVTTSRTATRANCFVVERVETVQLASFDVITVGFRSVKIAY